MAALDDVCVGAGERGAVAHEVGDVVVAEGAKVVGVGAVGRLFGIVSFLVLRISLAV